MAHVAIVTDSNSGITQAQAGELGIEVVPALPAAVGHYLGLYGGGL